MAINFDKDNDPILRGDVNVDAVTWNMGIGAQMAGLMPVRSFVEAGPSRKDSSVVIENPSLARKDGLRF